MKFLPTIAVLALCAVASLHAADAPSEELEAKFKATMNAATMSGRWIPLKDGVLGADKEDKYSIVGVEKVSGNSWIIRARLRDAVVPIPVKVEWAGDAAVIIVDHLQIPGANGYGGGAYNARVLIHEHTYAGTWSGDDHGGLISGVITNK